MLLVGWDILWLRWLEFWCIKKKKKSVSDLRITHQSFVLNCWLIYWWVLVHCHIMLQLYSATFFSKLSFVFPKHTDQCCKSWWILWGWAWQVPATKQPQTMIPLPGCTKWCFGLLWTSRVSLSACSDIIKQQLFKSHSQISWTCMHFNINSVKTSFSIFNSAFRLDLLKL